jgi:glycerate 2-kinase
VSPDDPRLKDAETRIVAAPSHSIAAATKLAEVAGLDVRNLGSALEGEARHLGEQQAQLALSLQSKSNPKDWLPTQSYAIKDNPDLLFG